MTPEQDPPDMAWSEPERALLTAARAERMPGALERGVRAALAQRLAAAPLRPALRPARALFTRTSLWGTLGVALLGATSYAVLRSAAPPLAARAPAVQPLPLSAAASPAPPAPTPGPVAPGLAPAAPAVAGVAASAGPLAASTRRPPVERPDPLHEELQLLQRARTALRRGELQQAARHLDAYAARFQPGVLRPESEALRIELDARRGQLALARRGAERFVAAYPEHPLRERVRDLVAHPAGQPDVP